MPTTFVDQVAAQVRSELGRYNMNQTELAARLGCSHSTIHNKLHGKVPFKTNELQNIAAILGIQPQDLIPTAAPLAKAS